MKRDHGYALLADLAGERARDAAVRLAHLNRLDTEARERLAMLERYREDYRVRMRPGAVSALSGALLTNHRQFLDRLDQAVNQQREEVERVAAALEARRKEWQADYRREQSFRTLMDRAALERAAESARRDQKNQDEMASGSALRAANTEPR